MRDKYLLARHSANFDRLFYCCQTLLLVVTNMDGYGKFRSVQRFYGCQNFLSVNARRIFQSEGNPYSASIQIPLQRSDKTLKAFSAAWPIDVVSLCHPFFVIAGKKHVVHRGAEFFRVIEKIFTGLKHGAAVSRHAGSHPHARHILSHRAGSCTIKLVLMAVYIDKSRRNHQISHINQMKFLCLQPPAGLLAAVKGGNPAALHYNRPGKETPFFTVEDTAAFQHQLFFHTGTLLYNTSLNPSIEYSLPSAFSSLASSSARICSFFTR